MQKYRKKEYQGDNFRQAIKHNTLHYLKRMVFSGFLVTALLLLLQIGILFVMFFWLNNYANLYYEAAVILAILCIVFIINDDSNPAYKLAWTVPIVLFPVAGTLLYFYFKYNFGTTAIRKVAFEIGKETRRFSSTGDELKEELKKESPEFFLLLL